MTDTAPEPSPDPMGPIVCAIADSSELAAVTVLRNSYLRAHPGSDFTVLVIDNSTSDAELGILCPADIGVDTEHLHRLATACTPEHLRGALLPILLRHQLSAGRAVLYLDPCVRVVAPFLDLIHTALAVQPVVVIPKVLAPLPRDNLRPTAEELRATGVFDPGFLVVAPGAEPLLAAMDRQVGTVPTTIGELLDAIPALFDHHVLREPGLGLSVWNAEQRPLGRDDEGAITASGRPLRTIHFTGFDPRRPWLLSSEIVDRPRTLLSRHPMLADLCARYRNDLAASGLTDHGPRPFTALVDGTEIPTALRAEFHEHWRSVSQDTPPSAFSDAEGFLRWATTDDRWARLLWESDPRLRREFPEPFGADATEFRAWCDGPGVDNGRLPARAIPPVRGVRELPPMVDQLGATVIGDGPIAQAITEALRVSGLPSSTEVSYPVVVHCDPAAPVPADRHVVGLGAHAVETAGFAEVWVLAESTRRVLPTLAPRLLRAPLPEAPLVDQPTRKAARARLGLADVIIFAGVVDHGRDRDGTALDLVSAFLIAFPSQDDVGLALVVRGARTHPEAAERLRLATHHDARVVLIERDDDPPGIPDDLISAADTLLWLPRFDHSATGLELAAAELTAHDLLRAVVRGVAVIAAATGAAAELLREVAVLIPAPTGVPEVAAAAEALGDFVARLDRSQQEAGDRRRRVLARYPLTESGRLLRERVEASYRTWRSRSAASQSPEDDPLRPLLLARHAVLRRPDTDAESRTPMAPALRKAVLRVLGHYDAHLRGVMSSVVDGVERTAAELLRRQELLSATAATLPAADLDALRVEITAMLPDKPAVTSDDADERGRALEDLIVEEARRRGQQGEVLAARIDRLTDALAKTLDRVESIERSVIDTLRERDTHADIGLTAAGEAIRTVDALRRVVVREHERAAARLRTEVGDPERTSLVLCDAGLLRLPAEDISMLPWLSTHGVWESEVGALIDSLVEPGGIFLDVGAYVGYHCVRVLSRLGTSGTVVAVEPCARARELLARNVEVNVSSAVADRLEVISVAAWDGSVELGARPALSGGLELGAEPSESEPDRISAVRLDKQIDGIPGLAGMPLSVVRVDVPDSAHRVLGGLVRLLRRDRPHVVCEFDIERTTASGADPTAVLREFCTWGYELVPVAFGVGSADVVALSPEEIFDLFSGAGGDSGSRPGTLWLRPRATRA